MHNFLNKTLAVVVKHASLWSVCGNLPIFHSILLKLIANQFSLAVLSQQTIEPQNSVQNLKIT